jgi:glycosyltransferase involved in cell wall biosynthesis
MKKLSVIVPLYNFENYIFDCIDSIFKQKTNFDFDVIIRDDNSTDKTQEKLNELKLKYSEIKILDGSENLGALNNIKLLLDNSDSEYIAYLDGDDLFGDDHKLQKQVDFLDENPDYVMTFTTTKYLYEDYTPPQEEDIFIISLKEEITTEDLLETNYVGVGRVVRNKKILT